MRCPTASGFITIHSGVGGLAKKPYTLLVGVVFEVLIAKELLLIGPGLCYTRDTPYSCADARDLRGVEVQEDGGEAGGRFGDGGSAGLAAGVGGWPVRDPCVSMSALVRQTNLRGGQTVMDEERDVGVGTDASCLAGGRVGCHDNDGVRAVRRFGEVCVVHQ